jgi:hypothetical protein
MMKKILLILCFTASVAQAGIVKSLGGFLFRNVNNISAAAAYYTGDAAFAGFVYSSATILQRSLGYVSSMPGFWYLHRNYSGSQHNNKCRQMLRSKGFNADDVLFPNFIKLKCATRNPLPLRVLTGKRAIISGDYNEKDIAILLHEYGHVLNKDDRNGRVIDLISACSVGAYSLLAQDPSLLVAAAITKLPGNLYGKFAERRADNFALKHSTHSERRDFIRFLEKHDSRDPLPWLKRYRSIVGPHPMVRTRIKKFSKGL